MSKINYRECNEPQHETKCKPYTRKGRNGVVIGHHVCIELLKLWRSHGCGGQHRHVWYDVEEIDGMLLLR